MHSFVTPKIGGKQFWAANNDGDGTAATNSLVFIDVVPESATFLAVDQASPTPSTWRAPRPSC